MKMNTGVFFILFIISSPLFGINSDDPTVALYMGVYCKKTNAELLEIVAQKNINVARKTAISEILAQRSLSANKARTCQISSNNDACIRKNIKYGLLPLAASGLFLTITHACFAYKNISQEEWQNTIGFNKKSALIVSKLSSSMATRLSRRLPY